MFYYPVIHFYYLFLSPLLITGRLHLINEINSKCAKLNFGIWDPHWSSYFN